VRGSFKYKDDRPNTDASAGINNVVSDFESYQTLDVFAGVRSADRAWDVSIWAKNITDEDEITQQRGPDANDLALRGGQYTEVNSLRERIVGVTGRYNF